MTATNHTLSGALLGAFLPLPIAIPAAIASHFILDAIPHFGKVDQKKNLMFLYKVAIVSDGLFMIALMVTIIVFHKWAMLACGFLAYFPDLSLVHYYFANNRSLQIEAKNAFMRFHLGIQYERPWGIIIEVLVALAMLPIFISQLNG